MGMLRTWLMGWLFCCQGCGTPVLASRDSGLRSRVDGFLCVWAKGASTTWLSVGWDDGHAPCCVILAFLCGHAMDMAHGLAVLLPIGCKDVAPWFLHQGIRVYVQGFIGFCVYGPRVQAQVECRVR